MVYVVTGTFSGPIELRQTQPHDRSFKKDFLTHEQSLKKRHGKKGYSSQQEKEIYYEGFEAAINLKKIISNPYIEEYRRVWETGFFEGYNAGMWYITSVTQDPLRYLKGIGVSYFVWASLLEISIKIPYFDVDTSILPRIEVSWKIRGGIETLEKRPYFPIDGFGPQRPLWRCGIADEEEIKSANQKWTWISNAKGADEVIE